jgi:hypothetical protein
MRVNNENLLDDSGPLDLSTNQTLNPIWLGHIVNYSIQLVFTGTPGGNFKLQASNDRGDINAPTQSAQDAGLMNWTDIADSAFTVSAAGNVMWDVQNAGHNWVRVVWTQTSGSGTLTVARSYVKGV